MRDVKTALKESKERLLNLIIDNQEVDLMSEMQKMSFSSQDDAKPMPASTGVTPQVYLDISGLAK